MSTISYTNLVRDVTKFESRSSYRYCCQSSVEFIKEDYELLCETELAARGALSASLTELGERIEKLRHRTWKHTCAEATFAIAATFLSYACLGSMSWVKRES